MINQRFQEKGYREQVLEVEVGLSISVVRAREDRYRLRERKIAHSTPKEFDFEWDV
jgi:hypothetical protein